MHVYQGVCDKDSDKDRKTQNKVESLLRTGGLHLLLVNFLLFCDKALLWAFEV